MLRNYGGHFSGPVALVKHLKMPISATVQLQQTKEVNTKMNVNKDTETLKYLKSLKSIRDRCEMVYSAVKSGHCEARFDVDEAKLDDVADFVADLIRKDYLDPSKDVPPHSRWRHFLPVGSIESSIIEPLKRARPGDSEEIVKCLLDLFVVSVLLDAGAGDKWKYTRKGGLEGPVGRSEGLAMASMDIFINGTFSSTGKDLRVDSVGLVKLEKEALATGLQVNPESNPLVGLDGRLNLLRRLGKVLIEPKNEKYFYNPKDSSHRPGNLIYFLLSHRGEGDVVDIECLWEVVIEGFGGVWPEEGRCKIGSVCLGDAWHTKILSDNTHSNTDNNTHTSTSITDDLVTFHKLSQWLTYSLLEPLEMFLNLKFRNKALMTGLAEYRNGGLFVDLQVLKLKEAYKGEASFPPGDEVIVQWRALTVCLLDRLAKPLRCRLNLTEESFTLPKMLEGGTWKAGRIVAKQLRPLTCGPPIIIESDGTLF